MRRAPASIRLLLVALLLSAGGRPLAAAESSSPAAREAELAQVREEIASLVNQLDELSVRAFGFQGALDKARLERRLQEQRVAEARAERDLAEARVADASARLGASEASLARERERLESRLVGLTRIGRHGQLRLAFALDASADPLRAVRLLRYLVRRDAASIERYEELRARVESERGELEKRRQESATWYAQQDERKRELERLEARQEALLAAVRREGGQLADRALALASRETELSNLLDTLFGRSAAPLAGRPIQEFRGHLESPVIGRVAIGFGPRLDPRYSTRVPHNGVGFETEPGSEVVAIYPGKVVYAAPFQSHGPTVVLQHAGRVFTLYAGLDSIAVAKDALLSLRQPLGRAASALYFEIRVENRPEDPERWMR